MTCTALARCCLESSSLLSAVAMISLVFAFMLFLVPHPDQQQLQSWVDLAQSVSDVATESPVFDGPKGQERTAALLVSLAFFESGFRGLKSVNFSPKRGDNGQSVGFFGIWPRKGDPSKDELEKDASLQVRLARERIVESFRSCSYGDPGDRLALYASGSCSRGLLESKHRWNQAVVLMREVYPRVQQSR